MIKCQGIKNKNTGGKGAVFRGGRGPSFGGTVVRGSIPEEIALAGDAFLGTGDETTDGGGKQGGGTYIEFVEPPFARLGLSNANSSNTDEITFCICYPSSFTKFRRKWNPPSRKNAQRKRKGLRTFELECRWLSRSEKPSKHSPPLGNPHTWDGCGSAP